MAWVQVSKIARRVSSYRNGVRGFRTENQPTNAILYAEDVNPVYDHLDVLTDAVNLAGQTAVVGNEGLGAIGESPLARGSMLVRGESAYENMPPGNSLQVPHWNSNVPRGMEPVTLLPGPWERVTLSHERYRHGDEWVLYSGGDPTKPIYPFAADNPRPGLFWRWEGRDIVRVVGAVVDTKYLYEPARNYSGTPAYVAELPAAYGVQQYVCTQGGSPVADAVGQPPYTGYFGLVTPGGRVVPYFRNDGSQPLGKAIYLNFTYTSTQQRP